MSLERMNEIKPWEKSLLEIKIIDIYEAEITGEEGNDYLIEFRDAEMEIVEASLPKKEFDGWPEQIKQGSVFGVVIYYHEKLSIGAWPIEKYWNPNLLKE